MNGNVVAFALIAWLFAFAVVALVFGDFIYCLAFLITIAGCFYFLDPRHDET
jgi:hypothetical protein